MSDAVFPRYLGADFAGLPPQVQALHRFDVAIHAPLTGALIVHCRGWLG